MWARLGSSLLSSLGFARCPDPPAFITSVCHHVYSCDVRDGTWASALPTEPQHLFFLISMHASQPYIRKLKLRSASVTAQCPTCFCIMVPTCCSVHVYAKFMQTGAQTPYWGLPVARFLITVGSGCSVIALVCSFSEAQASPLGAIRGPPSHLSQHPTPFSSGPSAVCSMELSRP